MKITQATTHLLNQSLPTGTQRPPYQAVRSAPLVLLCDVGHVRKDDREGNGEDARHGDHSKVPPEGAEERLVTELQIRRITG